MNASALLTENGAEVGNFVGVVGALAGLVGDLVGTDVDKGTVVGTVVEGMVVGTVVGKVVGFDEGTVTPTRFPSLLPSSTPSIPLSRNPTIDPTSSSSLTPTRKLTRYPTIEPTLIPSSTPTSLTSFTPTSFPTTVDENGSLSDDAADGDVRSVVGKELSNIVLFVVTFVFAAIQLVTLFVRRSCKEKLNTLKSNYSEVSDILLKSISVSVLVNMLLQRYVKNSEANGVSTLYDLVVISAIIRVIVWIVFVVFFAVPSSTLMISNVTLSSLIYKPLMLHTTFLLVMLVSLMDLTFIRLLPWTNTLFASAVNGYPNMLSVRLAMYGSTAAMLCQSIASIASLLAHGSVTNYIFAAICVMNSTMQLIYVLFFLIVSRSQKLKLILLHNDDAALLATLQIKHPKQSKAELRESFLRDITPMDIRDILNDFFLYLKGAYDEETIIVGSDVELEEGKEEENDCSTISALHNEVSMDGLELQVADKSYVDNRGIRFSEQSYTTSDKTVDILRKQLLNSGNMPLEYIPIASLKEEIAKLCKRASLDQEYDEKRLDYLLSCLNINPEYEKEQRVERENWNRMIEPFCEECLEVMRSYIPPSIFSETLDSMVGTHNVPKPLAKRIMTKKCLWLVRVNKDDIGRIHIAEFLGKFNTSGQNLDIVELAAVYGSLPNTLQNDFDDKKYKWRISMEENLKSLYNQKMSKILAKDKLRNKVYDGVQGWFGDRTSVYSMRAVNSVDRTESSDDHIK